MDVVRQWIREARSIAVLTGAQATALSFEGTTATGVHYRRGRHHLHAHRFKPRHLAGKGVQFDAGMARLQVA